MKTRETQQEIFDELMRNNSVRLSGFDTIASLSGIPKTMVKTMWWIKYQSFKRIPRTNFHLKPRPDLVEGNGRMLYEVVCEGYLVFHVTETAVMIVPNGFITDLGSIPEPLLWIVNKDDKHMLIAYLFHDMAVDYDFTSRLLTDVLLPEIGREMGAPWIKGRAVFWAVRLATLYRFLMQKKIPRSKYAQKNYSLIKVATKEYMRKHDLGNNYKFIINKI